MEKKKNNKVIVIDNWLFTKDEDGKIKVNRSSKFFDEQISFYF